MIYKDFKTQKITQFGVLAGQIQHMAAQKVGFTPRLLRQVVITCRFQAQLCCDFSAAKLGTGKLGPSASAAVA